MTQIRSSSLLDAAHDPVAFRIAVSAWFEDAVNRHLCLNYAPTGVDYEASQRWWMRERGEAGLTTAHWPAAVGGADLTLENQLIIVEEAARSGAPPLNLFTISLNHLPHTLLAWGTSDQKARYLPEILAGMVWCQGFSEPNAGSDLAALRMKAVRDGDHYIINGQKIWSSFSMYAGRCILLARTDPSSIRHAGITFFLVDMNTPGVEVRPIRQANGRAKFGEIFFTDVKVPASDVLGEEGGGWRVAQTTLSAERGVLSHEVAETLRQVMEKKFSCSIATDAPWLRDAEMRRRFIHLFGRMEALQRLIRKLVLDPEVKPDYAASYVKIMSSTLKRDYGEFLIISGGEEPLFETDGVDELADGGMIVYTSALGAMIAGGTNEIMRNIIAERGFGMPR